MTRHGSRARRAPSIALLATLVVVGGGGALLFAQDAPDATDPSVPPLANRHADPRAGITADNIGSLARAWHIPTKANVSHNPLVHDGRVYFGDWSGTVYAADLQSGSIAWQKQVQEEPNTQWPWHGFTGTGAIGERLLFEASAEGTAYAIDLDTGDVKWRRRFVEEGQEAGNAGTLLYHDGLVYIGVCSVEEMLAKTKPNFKPDFQGKVVALQASDGSVAWERRLIDGEGTGAAVWSAFALDPDAGTLFLTTSNNYTKPATKLSDAIVALDARTGQIRWSHQATPNDVWTMADPLGPDYAFAGGPQLFEATIDGKRRQLVGAAQKSGVYHALDRASGQVVWKSVIGYGGFGGGIMGEAGVGAGRVFVQSNNSFDPMNDDPAKSKANVKALAATDGSYAWALPTTKPAASHSGDFLSRDVFLTGALDGKIRAYAAADGALLWTSPAHASNASALVVAGETLLFGTGLPKMMGGTDGPTGLFAYRPGGGDVTRAQPAAAQQGPATGPATRQARTIEVQAFDFRFEPARIEAAPGEALAIRLVNKSDHPHNIEFELPSGERELEKPVPPGQSATLRFTAPEKAGEYTVYCPVGNHRERGMTGTLVVRQAR